MEIRGNKNLTEKGVVLLPIVVFSVVFLFGLVTLPQPFHGDQALFTLGAVKMQEGGVLYRDFWDVKQPGIFIFYLVAGKLFGFDEVGIHTFELVYMMVFGITLYFCLRRRFGDRKVAALLPFLTVAIYYGTSDSFHLTQVEGLVGFPIFLSAFFAAGCADGKMGVSVRAFFSGVMGGVVVVFKAALLPVLIGFWVNLLLDSAMREREKFKAVSITCVSIMLGLGIPLVAVGTYFWLHGAIRQLYETSFIYPLQMIDELTPFGAKHFLGALDWPIGKYSALAGLACIGLFRWLKEANDLFVRNLLLWIILGLCAIFLQRFSGWEYHYLLILPPLGILACSGMDLIAGLVRKNCRMNRRSGVVLLLAFCILVSPSLYGISKRGVYLALDRAWSGRGNLRDYQCRFARSYCSIPSDVAFLKDARSLPGDIVVWGNPLMLFLSGRNQAFPVNGWSPELLTGEKWREVEKQFIEADAPYVYVSRSSKGLIEKNSSKLVDVIAGKYRVLEEREEGTWYIRFSPTKAACPLEGVTGECSRWLCVDIGKRFVG